jgi:hypothetical protein
MLSGGAKRGAWHGVKQRRQATIEIINNFIIGVLYFITLVPTFSYVCVIPRSDAVYWACST